MSSYVCGRNEEYFSEPNEFKPERFLNENGFVCLFFSKLDKKNFKYIFKGSKLIHISHLVWVHAIV